MSWQKITNPTITWQDFSSAGWFSKWFVNGWFGEKYQSISSESVVWQEV